MTKFEAIRAITGVKEFSGLMFSLTKEVGTPEKLEEILSEELPEEGLQTIMSIAQKGNYPLSFDGLQ